MIGPDPLLQIHRVIKELRLALLLSHHDGNIPLADRVTLGYYFLPKTFDLGNTPSTLNIHSFFRGPLRGFAYRDRKSNKGQGINACFVCKTVDPFAARQSSNVK